MRTKSKKILNSFFAFPASFYTQSSSVSRNKLILVSLRSTESPFRKRKKKKGKVKKQEISGLEKKIQKDEKEKDELKKEKKI